MANARHAPRMTEPTSPMQQTSSSGPVAPSSSPPPRGITVASAPPAPSGSFDRRAAPCPDPDARQLATARISRVSHPATQNRRHSTSDVKPNKGLLTRMGLFFHRVSYRQHGTGSQRDDYSRP